MCVISIGYYQFPIKVNYNNTYDDVYLWNVVFCIVFME